MIMPQQQREHGRAARCLGIEVQTPCAYQLFFRALFTSARSAGKTLSTASKAAEFNSGSQAG